MLTNWVNAGGNLIAMQPDPQLARPSRDYVNRVDAVERLPCAWTHLPLRATASLVSPCSFTALRMFTRSVVLRTIATLYANATTATSNPAVTLRTVGTSGGHAAAFAYDLATSIVYTRQGNPAWAAQERDGVSPIRSDDKFFGSCHRRSRSPIGSI